MSLEPVEVLSGVFMVKSSKTAAQNKRECRLFLASHAVPGNMIVAKPQFKH
jgi:hypothetical protein